jgi:acyl-CoA thioester hydrolase
MSESPHAQLAAWDFAAPHVVTVEVLAADIDAYEHVNNSVYLSWLDRAAWSHSAKLGISLEHCVTALRRGMAAHRTEIDYLRAAVLSDRVLVGTWIVNTDAKLRVERRFQVRRAVDGETLARARIDYVCINLDTGRAARMPDVFRRAYTTTVPSGPTPH